MVGLGSLGIHGQIECVVGWGWEICFQNPEPVSATGGMIAQEQSHRVGDPPRPLHLLQEHSKFVKCDGVGGGRKRRQNFAIVVVIGIGMIGRCLRCLHGRNWSSKVVIVVMGGRRGLVENR